jgi:hypothetical protein
MWKDILFLLRNMKKLTLLRNPMHASNVEKPLVFQLPENT